MFNLFGNEKIIFDTKKMFQCTKLCLVFLIILISSFNSAIVLGNALKPNNPSLVIITPSSRDETIDVTNDKIISLLSQNNIHVEVKSFDNINQLSNYYKEIPNNKMIVIDGHGSDLGFKINDNLLISWKMFSQNIFQRNSKLPTILLSCYSSNIKSSDKNIVTFANKIDGIAGAYIVMEYALITYRSNLNSLTAIISKSIQNADIAQKIMKYPLSSKPYLEPVYTHEADPTSQIAETNLDNWAKNDKSNLQASGAFSSVHLTTFDECTSAAAIASYRHFCLRDYLLALDGVGGSEEADYFIVDPTFKEQVKSSLYSEYYSDVMDNHNKDALTFYNSLNNEANSLSHESSAQNIVDNAVAWAQQNWPLLILLIIAVIIILITDGFLIEADEVAAYTLIVLIPVGYPTSAITDAQDWTSDHEGDYLPKNTETYILGTSDSNLDSDYDSIGDFNEIFTYGTNPAKPDTDGDGLSDPMELFTLPSTYRAYTGNSLPSDAATNPNVPFDHSKTFSSYYYYKTALSYSVYQQYSTSVKVYYKSTTSSSYTYISSSYSLSTTVNYYPKINLKAEWYIGGYLIYTAAITVTNRYKVPTPMSITNPIVSANALSIDTANKPK